MSTSIAVLGAGGFIGNRTVEVLHLDGASVVPIVRQPAGLALPCRFDLPVRIADALDERALAAAFAGCDVAVIAVAGDRRTIVGSVQPVYRAAAAAGIRRIVYLSTASVHGQSPAAGTDETAALSARQPIAYNNAKVRAERLWSRCRAAGDVEVVVLRPGIVWGPRSQWTGGLADEMLSGEAYLVDGGHGICNAIYVDNVVHAIRLASEAPAADRQTLLIGDDETISWADLYRPVAHALGLDLGHLPTPPASSVTRRARCSMTMDRIGESVKRRIPAPIRAGLVAAYVTSGRSFGSAEGPHVTLERAMLHTCSYKLPSSRAEAVLGYHPVVAFDEGCRRSVAWLAFAGYPVRGGCSP